MVIAESTQSIQDMRSSRLYCKLNYIRKDLLFENIPGGHSLIEATMSPRLRILP